MRRKPRIYDIIIYSSLLLAIICLIIGSKSYLSSIRESSVKDVVKSTIKEISGNEMGEAVVLENEPVILKNYNKELIINNYFDNLLDKIIVDDFLPYEIISSWKEYEVLGFLYQKEVANNYYKYKVDIKVNKDAMIPVAINDKLSTEEYNVITLNVYIQMIDGDHFVVKKIDG